MKEPIRVVVTGAAGQISYSLLFRIAAGDLLGQEQPVILICLDIEQSMAALEGVKMELNDSTWHLVKDTPRVMGFIGGSKDKPIPISEEEAKGIMQQLEHGAEVAKPKITFEPGEMVRVIDGPFNDFSGAVEEVNYEKSKVRVAVLIFGRSTPVELNFNQIEKA